MCVFYHIALNFRGLKFSRSCLLFGIHSLFVIVKFQLLYCEENSVPKIFVMIIKFTKITKIFDHGNLDLYDTIGWHQ